MQQAQDPALKQHFRAELDVIQKTLEAMGIPPQGGGQTPSTAGQPGQPGGGNVESGTATSPGGTGSSGGPSTYDDLINQAAEKYGVSPDLVKAVIQQESAWDSNAVSPADARGLMQVKPGTAAEMGAGGADLYDPATNIDLGTRYLREMLESAGGDESTALLYYNAGPNATVGTVPAGQDISARQYANEVLAKV